MSYKKNINFFYCCCSHNIKLHFLSYSLFILIIIFPLLFSVLLNENVFFSDSFKKKVYVQQVYCLLLGFCWLSGEFWGGKKARKEFKGKESYSREEIMQVCVYRDISSFCCCSCLCGVSQGRSFVSDVIIVLWKNFNGSYRLIISPHLC